MKKHQGLILLLLSSTLLMSCSQNSSPSSATAQNNTVQVSQEKEKDAEPSQEKSVKAETQPEGKKPEEKVQETQKQSPIEAKTDVQALTKPKQNESPSSAPAPTPSEKTPSREEPAKPAPAQTVSLSVIGDKQRGVILPATSVAVEKGDTVLDILSQTMKAHKIQMEYSGMKATAYVNGIDNLYEFDDGPKSGWVFKVNGKGGERSAGSITVQPGDTIEWLYTIDLGKDVGVK